MQTQLFALGLEERVGWNLLLEEGGGILIFIYNVDCYFYMM